MQVIKNAVMCQGLGAKVLIQIGSTIFIWGNTGNNKAPRLEILLFQPYSKQRFIFNWRAA